MDSTKVLTSFVKLSAYGSLCRHRSTSVHIIWG